MDEGIPVNKNIKILLVNNTVSASDDVITRELASLGLQNLVVVAGAGLAVKEFVQQRGKVPYDVTFIRDQKDQDELELLKSIIEIDPSHYVVMLTDNITPDKVISSIKFGASGILSQPFTAGKMRVELDKYVLLREDKKTQYS